MNTVIVYALASSLISLGIAEDSVMYTPGSLSETDWENRGTLTDKDITDFKAGEFESISFNHHSIDAVCWPIVQTGDSIIDYNINPDVTPQLTMEIWIYPKSLGSVNNVDWVLGANLNGFDRGIIITSTYSEGMVLGTGHQWSSNKVSPPTINEWTHIVAVWNDDTTEATIYKNGGSLIDGGEQDTDYNTQTTIGNTNVALNSAGNNVFHFNGCIGKVSISNIALNAQQVADLYRESAGTFLGFGGISGGQGGVNGAGGLTLIPPTHTPAPIQSGDENTHCCAASDSVRDAFMECPELEKVQCDKNSMCQWIAKSDVGYCGWDGVSVIARANGEKCKLNMDETECDNYNYCVWNVGYPPEEYLDDLDQVLSVDMTLNNSGMSGYNKNIKIYGALLFIAMCAIFVVYSCYKYSISKKEKLLPTANVQILHKYGSV